MRHDGTGVVLYCDYFSSYIYTRIKTNEDLEKFFYLDFDLEAMFCIQIATLDSSDLYKPYYWEMNRRDLMSSHDRGPQTVGILRNNQRLMSIRLVSLEFTNQDREGLRQEPYMVLASTTTISLNVPVKLNFCYEPRGFLSSSRVNHGQKLRLYNAPVMCYLKYGIWMTPYCVSKR